MQRSTDGSKSGGRGEGCGGKKGKQGNFVGVEEENSKAEKTKKDVKK